MKYLKKLQEQLMRFLTYVRVNDENGNVSLTNIAMIVMLWKVYETDAKSITDLAGLVIALLGYQGKRVIEKRNKK